MGCLPIWNTLLLDCIVTHSLKYFLFQLNVTFSEWPSLTRTSTNLLPTSAQGGAF